MWINEDIAGVFAQRHAWAHTYQSRVGAHKWCNASRYDRAKNLDSLHIVTCMGLRKIDCHTGVSRINRRYRGEGRIFTATSCVRLWSRRTMGALCLRFCLTSLGVHVSFIWVGLFTFAAHSCKKPRLFPDLRRMLNVFFCCYTYCLELSPWKRELGKYYNDISSAPHVPFNRYCPMVPFHMLTIWNSKWILYCQMLFGLKATAPWLYSRNHYHLELITQHPHGKHSDVSRMKFSPGSN